MEYSYVTGKSASDSELGTLEPTWRLLGKVNTQSSHPRGARLTHCEPKAERKREYHKAPRVRRIGKPTRSGS